MSEIKDEKIEKNETFQSNNELSSKEKNTQVFESLSDEKKNEVVDKFVDEESFKKWSKDNPGSSRDDYFSSLLKEYGDSEMDESASSRNDVLNESNSDIAGQPREVPECGLSCLMSRESYEKVRNGEYGKYGQVIGRDDGLFVAPTDQINQLIEECDGDVSKISEKLGVDFDSENLVRISISKEDADKLHPIYPTGRESGANEYWSGGGKTVLVDKETNKEIGVGLDEFVIDPVDLNEVGVQVTEINGYKSYAEE